MTGVDRPPDPVDTVSPARLSQKSVADLGSQTEIAGQQTTVVSAWTVLVPPDKPLTSATIVIDESGAQYAIEGDVARRPNHRPVFLAASARLVSDMQQ